MNKTHVAYSLGFAFFCSLIIGGIVQRLPEVRQVIRPITCPSGELRVADGDISVTIGGELQCLTGDRLVNIGLVNFTVVWGFISIAFSAIIFATFWRDALRSGASSRKEGIRGTSGLSKQIPNLPPEKKLALSLSGAAADAEVRRLLSQNQKINAIKIVREATQWGLKESKDYVDQIQAGVPVQPLAGGEPGQTPNPMPISKRPINMDPNDEVQNLIAAGKKINAIKLVREKTGWGLKESKDYVDRLEAGISAPSPASGEPANPFPLSERPINMDPNDEVQNLIASGKKINAIKLVREITGWGLKESKDYVDRIAAGENVPRLG